MGTPKKRKPEKKHSGKDPKEGSGNGRKGFFGKLAFDVLSRVIANAVNDGVSDIFGEDDFDIQPDIDENDEDDAEDTDEDE